MKGKVRKSKTERKKRGGVREKKGEKLFYVPQRLLRAGGMVAV